MLWKLIKFLIFLAILGAIGLIAFAYVGPILMQSKFAPPTQEITLPVTLKDN